VTLLIPGPPRFELPLSKGGDLYCVFVYKPLVVDGNGNPVLDASGNRQYTETDYPAGAAVTLTIDGDTPVAMDATIVGSAATVWEDKAVVDVVPKGKLWRAVITYADGRDVVMCNGVTVRSDGK
jgi:hypothetical protein